MLAFIGAGLTIPHIGTHFLLHFKILTSDLVGLQRKQQAVRLPETSSGSA